MEEQEPSKSGGFWSRLKANRYAFESILFEHKAIRVNDKIWLGLAGALLIWVIGVIFLFEWLQHKSPLLSKAEAQTFSAVLHYVSALDEQSIWTFIKPDFTSLRYSPPFYYLLYVPVLKFFTSDLNTALLIVNSIFLLIMSLMPFFAVSITRGWAGGLLASAAVMSFPFVTEAARLPNISLPLMAMVTGFYCSFICYKEFVDNKWSYAMALFFAFGFYTSGIFWIYTIPLWQALFTGITNNVNGARFFKVLLPGFLVNAPWYLCFIILLASGILPLRGNYSGFLDLLKHALPEVGLLLAVLGGVSLIWLYFNSYQPYEKRKDLARMFWVPWAVFTFGLCSNEPSTLYPVFISFALALAIMVPYRIEKLLLIMFLFAFFANNLSAPVKFAGFPLFGTDRAASENMPSDDIFRLTKANLPQGKSTIAVYSNDGTLNAESFSFAFNNKNHNAKFVNAPKLPDFSSLVLNKVSPIGISSVEFEKFRSEESFPHMFSKIAELPCKDGAKVEFYIKQGKPFGIFPNGKYPIGNLTLGQFTANSVTLGIENYDVNSASYGGYLFAPSANLYGGDIYGLKIAVDGIKFSEVNGSPALSALGKARITSARLSSYTIESVLRQKLGFLQNLVVSMDNDRLVIDANIRGHKIVVWFKVSIPSEGIIEISPVAFSFMGVNWPEGMQFLLKIFAYRLNLAENSYGLTVNSIKMSNGIMEIK